jgi:hypothetical protein
MAHLLGVLYHTTGEEKSRGVIDFVNAFLALPRVAMFGFYPGENVTAEGNCPICSTSLM